MNKLHQREEKTISDVVISTRIDDNKTFVEINKLASKVYDPTIVLPATLLESWYRVNPDIFWIARIVSEKTLVGYICAIPLTDETFQKTLDPQFDEMRDIPPSAVVRYEKSGVYRVYFVSIVVDPVYQHIRVTKTQQTLSRLLRNSFLSFLVSLEQKGMIVTELSAMAVSDIGEAVMRSLGMKVVVKTEKSRLMHCHTSPSRLRQLIVTEKSKL